MINVSSFIQAGKSALHDARRNLRLSFFTVLLILVAFLFADIIVFLSHITSASVAALNEQFQVTAYFNADVDEGQIQTAEEELASVVGIRGVEFVSAAEARRRFEERHTEDADLLDALRLFEENPLGGRLVLTLKDPSMFDDVRAAIRESTFAPLLRDTDFLDTEDVLSQVANVTEKIERAATILFAAFSLFVLFAVYSVVTIRVAAQRDAIHVMHMVGATDRFIRLPFFLLTVGFVIVALAINVFLVLFLQAMFGDGARLFVTGLPRNPVDTFFLGLMWITLWKGLLASALISISTMVALRKFA
jgi:cell division transport system permease protein